MAVALESLEVDFNEVFASEKCEHTRSVLKHNFQIPDKMVYHDAADRGGKPPPSCDFYSAGFPCQSYSSQGQGEGLNCHQGF